MSCCDRFVMAESNDEFKMWQGLVGAHYTPYVDANGNLSWTNNGGLANPPTVNIKGEPGTGLTIKGVVEAISDLPTIANNGDVYLVGTDAPYSGYLFANGSWTYIGVVGVGEAGRGIVSITKTSSSGLVDTYTITYTDGVNPTTFTVTNGADGDPGAPGIGVPTGGTTGQVLKKSSNADYDFEWGVAGEPSTTAPLMDGDADAGSSEKYAREDHVHPTDTSRASQSDMTTAQAAISQNTQFSKWVTFTAAGTQTISDSRFTADYILDDYQFFSGADAVSDVLADMTVETTTGVATVTITTVHSNGKVRLDFSYSEGSGTQS